MKTNAKSILAAAMTAPMIAGCVMIVDPDIDDHYADGCSDCHVVIYDKPVADTTAMPLDSLRTAPCTRADM